MVPLFYFEILDLLSNFMFSLLENFTDALIRGCYGIIDMYCTGVKNLNTEVYWGFSTFTEQKENCEENLTRRVTQP